jgi:hypothetical protein
MPVLFMASPEASYIIGPTLSWPAGSVLVALVAEGVRLEHLEGVNGHRFSGIRVDVDDPGPS